MQYAIYLILGFLYCGCNSQSPITTTLSQDEYDVYSTVMKYHVETSSIEKPDTTRNIFIYHSTIRGRLIGERIYSKYNPKTSYGDTSISLSMFSKTIDWKRIESEYKNVWHDTIKVITERLNIPYNMISFSSIDTFDRRLQPKWIGEFSFSRIGFNSDRTEALVYYHVKAPWLDGELNALVRKENGVWRFIKGYGFVQSEWYSEMMFIPITPSNPKPTVGNPVPIPTKDNYDSLMLLNLAVP